MYISYVPRCWNFLEWQNLVQNSYNDYMGKGESIVASSWQYSLAPFEQKTLKTPPVPSSEDLES